MQRLAEASVHPEDTAEHPDRESCLFGGRGGQT